jgi:hypothetical protein
MRYYTVPRVFYASYLVNNTSEAETQNHTFATPVRWRQLVSIVLWIALGVHT